MRRPFYNFWPIALVAVFISTVALAQPIESLDDLKMDKFSTFHSHGGVDYLVWQYTGSCKKGATSSTQDIDENAKACNGIDFDGKSRVNAKTSFATGDAEEVDDYEAFIQSLPEDDSMCSRRIPKIKSTTARLEEEKRNVTVSNIWLYAFKRQNDEDYHLMVGIASDYETANDHGFYNMEISGLPEAAPGSTVYKQIKKVRDDFEGFFGITNCGTVCRAYVDLYLNPIKIEVTGSIFYDTDHCHLPASPRDYPVITAWEIHPIREIKFIE